MEKLNSNISSPSLISENKKAFAFSFLKYFIPFDREMIDSPLAAGEATERLRATTVKRHWVRVLAAVPGTFEGTVEDDCFSVLTSAEGYRLFGFARMRNLGRPVCRGRLSPVPGGCRAAVTFRPQGVMIAVMTYLFVFGLLMVPLVPADTWRQNHIDPALPRAFPVIFVLNYAIGTAAFWFMRGRAVRALKAVLEA